MGLGFSFSTVVTHTHGERAHRHWQRSDGSLSRSFAMDGPLPPDLRPGERVVRTVKSSRPTAADRPKDVVIERDGDHEAKEY